MKIQKYFNKLKSLDKIIKSKKLKMLNMELVNHQSYSLVVVAGWFGWV